METHKEKYDKFQRELKKEEERIKRLLKSELGINIEFKEPEL